jgi:hypothetical protein
MLRRKIWIMISRYGVLPSWYHDILSSECIECEKARKLESDNFWETTKVARVRMTAFLFSLVDKKFNSKSIIFNNSSKTFPKPIHSTNLIFIAIRSILAKAPSQKRNPENFFRRSYNNLTLIYVYSI